MKTLALIIGTLLLIGCSTAKADHVTSWGTHFVYDAVRVTSIYKAERACLQRTLATSDSNAGQLRSRLEDCYWDANDDLRISEDPPTYYFMPGQEGGDGPFMEFDLCVSGLASHTWDFPDDSEETTAHFRESVQDCISLFPVDK